MEYFHPNYEILLHKLKIWHIFALQVNYESQPAIPGTFQTYSINY